MYIKTTHCSLFACFAVSLVSIYMTEPTSLINLLKRNINSRVQAYDQLYLCNKVNVMKKESYCNNTGCTLRITLVNKFTL